MYHVLSIAATFFCTYELTRSLLGGRLPEKYAPFVNMLAASLGEVVREFAIHEVTLINLKFLN